MGSAEHNRLRSHGLALLVMDHLRDRIAVGEQVTLWSLNRDLCDRFKIHGRPREAMYQRVRSMVESFEGSGLLTTEKRWDAENERYTKLIFLCSVN